MKYRLDALEFEINGNSVFWDANDVKYPTRLANTALRKIATAAAACAALCT